MSNRPVERHYLLTCGCTITARSVDPWPARVTTYCREHFMQGVVKCLDEAVDVGRD